MIGEREKYSYYEFEILENSDDDYPAEKYYCYKIYTEGCPPYDDGVIEETNGHETEEESRVAAIAHITKLENGPDDVEYL